MTIRSKAIKQELQLHGQCEELALDFLSEAAVAEYLTMRLTRLPHPAVDWRGQVSKGRGTFVARPTQAGPPHSSAHGWQSAVHGERDQ